MPIKGPQRPSGRLTTREQQVLAGLMGGLTSRQIGVELSISPRTVDTHVHNILKKLRARNRIHAVAIASRLELRPRRPRPS